jgi:hypothetical protein
MNDAVSPLHSPPLSTARRILLEHALTRGFPQGRIALPDNDSGNFFKVLLPQMEFASWIAAEWADAQGSHYNDARLVESALLVVENAVAQFQDDGRVTANGDLNTPYFSLCPLTRVLLLLQPALDAAKFGALTSRCAQLYDTAVKNLRRSHDYPNVRGMEALAATNLHSLTGETRFLTAAHECLDELVKRQYTCGAQPYHTGAWVWGRRPAQVYQLLTTTMMLAAGRKLNRGDVTEYVKRVAEYEMLANNRHGEPFVTPFEGLDRSDTFAANAWQWPVIAAFGGEFQQLAARSYANWIAPTLGLIEKDNHNWADAKPVYASVLNKALMLEVGELHPSDAFSPPPGLHPCPDISTVFIHQPSLDLCMTLLTGHSAFVQADCGELRLYTLTAELTDTPTFRNAGTDALRYAWTQPTEQLACEVDEHSAQLHGRVFTKWDNQHHTQDQRLGHARELEVKMTFKNQELIFEYKTIKNAHLEPVSNRILFLLGTRRNDTAPQLSIGEDTHQLPADGESAFCIKGEIALVRFFVPGSTIEIVPEEMGADYILAERPERQSVPYPGKENNAFLSTAIKPCGEGTFRLSFEGPRTLDGGRLRIKFC